MKAGGVFTGGLTTAASLAVDAYTVFEISRILKDVISEESGGIRRPDKMLFGGSANLEGQKF